MNEQEFKQRTKQLALRVIKLASKFTAQKYRF